MARVERWSSERPWLARAALLSTLFAVIATDEPPSYVYEYTTQVSGPPTELTQEAPARRFRLRVRATGLAPNGARTTDSVDVQLTGRISRPSALAEPTFVSASWDDGSAAPGETLSAVTEFALYRQLAFEGACDAPESGPCEAEATIALARTDAGTAGGSITVDWSLTLRGSVHKSGEPDVSLAPPWNIEVVEE